MRTFPRVLDAAVHQNGAFCFLRGLGSVIVFLVDVARIVGLPDLCFRSQY